MFYTIVTMRSMIFTCGVGLPQERIDMVCSIRVDVKNVFTLSILFLNAFVNVFILLNNPSKLLFA